MTLNADYLEGLMEGFVAYDGDWRMTYMNAAAERILGRKRDDVLGKTWHQAFPHAVALFWLYAAGLVAASGLAGPTQGQREPERAALAGSAAFSPNSAPVQRHQLTRDR